MNGTPNAATFGSPDPNTVAYGNNPDPNAAMRNTVSPMVQQLQSFGRNNDTQLVHMTPGEVGGLQALAKAHGGSLTTNPHTGLPEAGFLENILPTLLGVGLSFIPGVGPLMAAGITGVGTTAVTGDLNKGLMAGLGAFGGASLAGGLGIGAASSTLPGATLSTTLPAATTAGGIAAPAAALPSAVTSGTVAGSQISQAAQAAGAAMQAPGFIPASAVNAATTATGMTPSTLAGLASPSATGALAGAAPGANAAEIALRTGAAAPSAAGNPMLSNLLGPELGAKAGTFGQKFANAAGENLMGTATKPSVMRTAAAAMGAGMPIMQAMQPEYKAYEPPKSKWNYEGPYKPQDRKVRFPTEMPTDREFSYFEDTNPYPGYLTSKGEMPEGFADGGSTGPVFSQTTGGIEAGYMPQAAPQAAVDPAQFSALQSAPMASIFAPAQTQTYGAAPQVSGAGLAQLMLPSGRQFMQSMEHAKVAGPMAFTPFKTEKETIEAAKAKPTTTTGTPTTGTGTTTGTPTTGTGTTTPATGTGTTRTTINTPKGGGNDTSTLDWGTGEDIGDPEDGRYVGLGNGRDFQGRGGDVITEPFPTTGGDSTTWVDPNIDPTQWDPDVDYTGGVDLTGLDFSNIGNLGGSYQGNPEGYDAGQAFVNTMDLSNLSSYDPEQFKRDIAMGNYGGSDINGNPFVGGSDDSVRVDETGMPGPEDVPTFPAYDPNLNLGGGFGGDYQPDFSSFQPTNTFDLGSYQPDFGNFSPADFSGVGNDIYSSGSDMSYNGVDYSAYSPADYGAGTTAAADMYSPSDYYGMDTSGGFEGIGNDYGFDQGSFGLFAKGGQVPLEDGAFIVDARTVSELGNGSSRAGQDLLAKYGGKTLHGPGDGVSDSIRANIGGKQDARVARDEVKFSPQAVAKIGGGDLHKGTKKLYAMMDRAQKARQSAQRGQNTGLQGILNR